MNITRGHPILVKFSLLANGLYTDVVRRYSDYLRGESRKIQTTLVCSLLDIAGLPITETFLKDIGFLREAYSLEYATLYQPTKGSWKTIHPRWDEEMLSFLYNKSKEINKMDLEDNNQYLKTALDSIFNVKDEERAYAVIGTIYDIAAHRIIPIELAESVIQIPFTLSIVSLFLGMGGRSNSSICSSVTAIL